MMKKRREKIWKPGAGRRKSGGVEKNCEERKKGIALLVMEGAAAGF